MHPIERLRYVARAGDEDPGVIAEEAALALAGLSFDDRRALLPSCRRLLEFHPSCGPLWWVVAHLLVADDLRAAASHVLEQLSADPTPDELAAAFPSQAVLVATSARASVDAFLLRPDLEIRLFGKPRALRSALRTLGLNGAVSAWEEDEIEVALHGVQLVVIEALAAGASGCVVDSLSGALANSAAREGISIWAVLGMGRLLPEALFQALCQKSAPRALDGLGSDDDGALFADDELDDFEQADQWRPPRPVLVPAAAIGKVIGPRGPGATGPGLSHPLCPSPIELLLAGNLG